MAEKTKRLSKVAREFNVGTSTIVEFLDNKGETIDSNPNSKITEKQYEILSKEFSSDVKAKEASKKVDLKSTRKKKETISIEPKKTENDNNKVDISVKDEAKVENKVKVVGKIDLKKTSKPAKAEKEVELTPKKEEPKVAETKTKKEKEDVTTSTDKPIIKDEVKVIGKIDLDKINQRTRPQRKSKAEKEKERK